MMLGLFTGSQTICTGIEDDPSGALRVYVGPRYKGVYALLTNERDIAVMRRAWGSMSAHIVIPTPSADSLFHDELRPPLLAEEGT